MVLYITCKKLGDSSLVVRSKPIILSPQWLRARGRDAVGQQQIAMQSAKHLRRKASISVCIRYKTVVRVT